jgi:Fe-S cluster biogenesis protein NfuA
MFIQTETTPNEASLKFIPGVTVTGGSSHEFLDLRSALPSPLATRLLTIEGVVEVFFGPDFVTCSKDESLNWSILKPEVFAVLMEHFSSGQPLFKDGQDTSGAEDTRILDTDSEVVGMIKELLETRVRPAIQEDGGDIEFKGFEEEAGLVKLKLKGSCRGCSSSSVTLKNGIERMLMHYVPEVKGVEQVSHLLARLSWSMTDRQVLDEEEMIALDEFAKLEARLEKKKKPEAKQE